MTDSKVLEIAKEYYGQNKNHVVWELRKERPGDIYSHRSNHFEKVRMLVGQNVLFSENDLVHLYEESLPEVQKAVEEFESKGEKFLKEFHEYMVKICNDEKRIWNFLPRGFDKNPWQNIFIEKLFYNPYVYRNVSSHARVEEILGDDKRFPKSTCYNFDGFLNWMSTIDKRKSTVSNRDGAPQDVDTYEYHLTSFETLSSRLLEFMSSCAKSKYDVADTEDFLISNMVFVRSGGTFGQGNFIDLENFCPGFVPKSYLNFSNKRWKEIFDEEFLHYIRTAWTSMFYSKMEQVSREEVVRRVKIVFGMYLHLFEEMCVFEFNDVRSLLHNARNLHGDWKDLIQKFRKIDEDDPMKQKREIPYIKSQVPRIFSVDKRRPLYKNAPNFIYELYGGDRITFTTNDHLFHDNGKQIGIKERLGWKDWMASCDHLVVGLPPAFEIEVAGNNYHPADGWKREYDIEELVDHDFYDLLKKCGCKQVDSNFRLPLQMIGKFYGMVLDFLVENFYGKQLTVVVSRWHSYINSDGRERARHYSFNSIESERLGRRDFFLNWFQNFSFMSDRPNNIPGKPVRPDCQNMLLYSQDFDDKNRQTIYYNDDNVEEYYQTFDSGHPDWKKDRFYKSRYLYQNENLQEWSHVVNRVKELKQLAKDG